MRKNKTKKEIVSTIQLTQDAERRRALIKQILYPYIISLKDTIGYTKVFLQSFSSLVDGAFGAQRKTTTIAHIAPQLDEKLREIFKLSDPEQKKEYDRYKGLINLLKDISVDDLVYATELPRFVDGYFTQEAGKQPIETITTDILNKIMG